MTQRPTPNLTSTFVHDLRSAVAAMRVLTQSRVPQTAGELTGAFQMALGRVESLVMGLVEQKSDQNPPHLFQSLGEVFENIHALQGARAHLEFGVQMQMQISAGAAGLNPDILPLPALELVRVIENLCLNAAQASLRTPERSFYVVKLTAKLQGSRLWILVRDNGPGLPPEIQADPFIGRSIGKRKGSGLGLRYCKETVERAGGLLKFRTSTENGTAFLIQLPLRNRSARHKDWLAGMPANGSKSK